MKAFLLSIFSLFIFSACCFERKCNDNDLWLKFRFVNASNGADLVFGSSKIYDKDSIKFFSLNGTDTIRYNYTISAEYNKGIIDSVFGVPIQGLDNKPVFVHLNSVDIDTLIVYYQNHDGGRCCDDTKSIQPWSYNNQYIKQIDGITVLTK